MVAARGSTLWNALFRFGAQFIAIIINILATPYILRNLGVESFGVVGVINALISFMSLGAALLTSTIGRNLTLAVERGELDRANKEISTAVFGLLALFGAAFLPLFAMAIAIDRLIVVSPGLVSGARTLFLLTILAFGFTALSGPLGAAMFVRNRLDLFSGAALLRTVFFVLALVALFSTAGSTLTTYGIALLASSVLICTVHFRIYKRLMPGIEISFRWFDRSILNGIISLGGWMMVAQLGALLFLQADLLVANRVLGGKAAGQLAAISVVPLHLRSLASLCSGLFAPNQTALWAREEWTAFSSYLFRSIRITTLAMALLVGAFCGSVRPILSIWLGQEFASLAPVAIMLTAYLVISLGVMPSWNAALALGKVKVPAAITLAMGAGHVVLSIALARSMGLMGIALSGCLMLTARNTLFTPWYISKQCRFRQSRFWLELGLGSLYGMVVYFISLFVSTQLAPKSMRMLVASLMLTIVLGVSLLIPYGLREFKDFRSRIVPPLGVSPPGA